MKRAQGIILAFVGFPLMVIGIALAMTGAWLCEGWLGKDGI